MPRAANVGSRAEWRNLPSIIAAERRITQAVVSGSFGRAPRAETPSGTSRTGHRRERGRVWSRDAYRTSLHDGCLRLDSVACPALPGAPAGRQDLERIRLPRTAGAGRGGAVGGV